MDAAETRVVVSEEPDDQFESFLKSRIRNFNNETSDLFREVRKGPKSPKPINIRLLDGTGRAVGGLCASTYWGWLDIDDFYVPESLRHSGLGSRILARVESIAMSRGCRSARLTTYEFQARTFYEKNGWRVVGTLDDYPPGSSYHLMRKDFS